MLNSYETTRLLIKIKIARLDLLVYRFLKFVLPPVSNAYKRNLQNRLNVLNSEVLNKLS
ncbi:hypothetical protein [Clostridium kluyveri]|uniref:hypothetical protein n=1 Tax=Clostridium kluyveri TaxID=1534 RepID=UPI0012EBD235|nr:hypothetical protein [Clostridium kluyveri]